MAYKYNGTGYHYGFGPGDVVVENDIRIINLNVQLMLEAGELVPTDEDPTDTKGIFTAEIPDATIAEIIGDITGEPAPEDTLESLDE